MVLQKIHLIKNFKQLIYTRYKLTYAIYTRYKLAYADNIQLDLITIL